MDAIKLDINELNFYSQNGLLDDFLANFEGNNLNLRASKNKPDPERLGELENIITRTINFETELLNHKAKFSASKFIRKLRADLLSKSATNSSLAKSLYINNKIDAKVYSNIKGLFRQNDEQFRPLQ